MERPKFERGLRERPVPFSKTKQGQTPQQQGRQRERVLAKDLNGRQQPGSGCFPGRGGDVIQDEFLIEHKYTRALSYSVTIRTLRKIKLEAEQARKKPVLIFEIEGQMMFPPEKWAVVPYEIFKEMLEMTRQ